MPASHLHVIIREQESEQETEQESRESKAEQLKPDVEHGVYRKASVVGIHELRLEQVEVEAVACQREEEHSCGDDEVSGCIVDGDREDDVDQHGPQREVRCVRDPQLIE